MITRKKFIITLAGVPFWGIIAGPFGDMHTEMMQQVTRMEEQINQLHEEMEQLYQADQKNLLKKVREKTSQITPFKQDTHSFGMRMHESDNKLTIEIPLGQEIKELEGQSLQAHIQKGKLRLEVPLLEGSLRIKLTELDISCTTRFEKTKEKEKDGAQFSKKTFLSASASSITLPRKIDLSNVEEIKITQNNSAIIISAPFKKTESKHTKVIPVNRINS